MIDVGEVVRAFLSRPTSIGLLRVLAAPLHSENAVQTLAFLGACHDLGKVSPGFQRKRPDLAPRLDSPPFLLTESDHGKITFWTFADHLRRRGVEELAPDIAAAVAGHHGTFPGGAPSTVKVGGAAWDEARRRHAEALESVFQPDLHPLVGRSDPLPAAWYLLLAGLVSICDWVGSAEEHFPYEPSGANDVLAYSRWAADRAQRALTAIGIAGWRADGWSPSFDDMFPGYVPNAMQAELLAQGERASAPGLYVVEAPMGTGKTEAALALAERLVRRMGLGGVYYALPTQATSNQMFDRLRAFLARRYPGVTIDLHLLHAMSDLNAAYRSLKIAAIAQSSAETLRASAWFVAAKRGLLAPFGVGTIDQALLAVMQVRHFFVRLLGLAGKVVILDEVHAYDTYVSELLDHLVAWLAALGSPVIVLSATLPSRRRAALVRAYSGSEAPDAVAYPAVTTAERGGPPRAIACAPVRRSELSVKGIEVLPAEELAEGARLLARLVRDGGCAAWVCNTVDRAQRAYEAVRRAVGPDLDVRLLHARFPAAWRRDREESVLRAFGKTAVERPGRAILVATQVIEQSLDLDFDAMVTDPAPIDLVLQRAGRLHRHPERPRPPALASPTLHWLEPPVEDGAPRFGVHEMVYDRYVLLRSWLALRESRRIVLPDDLPRLIERVYGDETETPDAFLRTALAEALERFTRERECVLAKAERNEIGSPEHEGPLGLLQNVMLTEDEDPKIHETLRAMTRLIRPSVQLVCARRNGTEAFLVDGTLVRPEGGRPSADFVRRARLSSVAIQSAEWVRHFWDQPPPPAWRDTASLRECRLALFDNEVLDVGLSTKLRLSVNLGIVRERAGDSR